MLAPQRFVLQTAASGAEALASVAADPPDLVLLDVMMPGIDGYEVAKRLRDNVATTSIPIIVITAHGDHERRCVPSRPAPRTF